MKNITRMSLKELLAHEAAVQKQLVATKTSTVTKLRAGFMKEVAAAGLQQDDLFLGSTQGWSRSVPVRAPRLIDISSVKRVGLRALPAKRKATTKKVAVKYRNKKTGETWTGRGRMATWLATAVKGGKKLESFLVKQT